MADVTASGAAPPASRTAAAAAAAAKPSTSKKPLKPRKIVQPAEHPKYREMIALAIITLNQRGGSSRQAIMKHILAHYKVGSEINKVNGRMKLALRAGIQSGSLQQTKGTGASGSFKLGVVVKSVKPRPAKAVAKKVAAGKKVAVRAKKLKSAALTNLKGKWPKKGALAKNPKGKSPAAKKGAKAKKVVKKTPTKKRSSSKLAKK